MIRKHVGFGLLMLSVIVVFISWHYTRERSFENYKQSLNPASLVGREFLKPQIEENLRHLAHEAMETFRNAELFRREEKLIKALDLYTQTKEKFEEIGSENGLAYCFLCLGIVNELLSNLSDALNYFNKAQELFQKINDKKGLSHTLRWLAHRYYQQGNFQYSLALGREALLLVNNTDDIILRIKILSKIGDCLVFLGKRDQAQKMYYSQVIELSKRSDYLRGQAYGFYGLSLASSNVKDAMENCEKCLTISRQLGDKRREARALCRMAVLAVQQNSLEQAGNLFDQSLALYANIKDRRGKARVMLGLAFLKEKENESEEARKLFDEALKEFEEIGDVYHQYESLVHKAELYSREGNYRASEDLLRKAWDIVAPFKCSIYFVKLLLALGHLKKDERNFTEAQEFYEKALGLAQEIKVNELIAEAYTGIGCINYITNSNSTSESNLQKGLELITENGMICSKGDAYLLLGFLKRRTGKTQEAFAYFEKAKAVFANSHSNIGVLKVQSSIASLKRELGDYQEAAAIMRQLYQEALFIRNKKRECFLLINLAHIDFILGHFKEAEIRYEKAMEIAKNRNDLRGQASVYLGQSYLLDRQGYIGLALEKAEISLELFRKIGDKSQEALTLQAMGRIYTRIGRVEDANSTLTESLTICNEINFAYGVVASLTSLGSLNHEQSNFGQALDYYTQALQIAESAGYKRNIGFLLNKIGSIKYVLGDYKQASENLNKALVLSKKLGDPSLEGEVQTEQGNFLLYKGEWSAARNTLEQALVLLRKAKSKTEEGKTLRILQSLEIAMHEDDSSFNSYGISMEIMREVKNLNEQNRIFMSLGRNNLYSRNLSQAREIMLKAYSFFREGKKPLWASDSSASTK